MNVAQAGLADVGSVIAAADKAVYPSEDFNTWTAGDCIFLFQRETVDRLVTISALSSGTKQEQRLDYGFCKLTANPQSPLVLSNRYGQHEYFRRIIGSKNAPCSNRRRDQRTEIFKAAKAHFQPDA